MSDCGPQFAFECFARFCESWFVEHVASSPGHQRENGKVEAAVKSVKNMLKRTQGKQEDRLPILHCCSCEILLDEM